MCGEAGSSLTGAILDVRFFAFFAFGGAFGDGTLDLRIQSGRALQIV